LVPFIPAASILMNVFLMLKLSPMTWVRFTVWVAAGKITSANGTNISLCKDHVLCSTDRPCKPNIMSGGTEMVAFSGWNIVPFNLNDRQIVWLLNTD
jgi:hypothetical protein